MSKLRGNAKVAKNRGVKWRKNLLKGRLEAQLKPTEVQRRRVTKEITQKMIAKKIKVSMATWGGIERSKRQVTEVRANEIAKIVGAQRAQIFRQAGKGKYLAKFIDLK